MRISPRLEMPEGTGTGGGGTGGNSGATGTTQQRTGEPGAGGGAAAGAGTGTGAGAPGNAGGNPAGGSAGAAGAAGAASGGQAGASAPSAADLWNAAKTSWAGADDKKVAWIGRRTDFASVADSAYAADARINELSVQLKALPPGANATAEQVTQFRKDNGIPEKPDGYLVGLPDGTFTEADRPVVDPYLAVMHRNNLSPAVARELMGARAQVIDQLIQTQNENDQRMRTAVTDQLNKDWGGEYRANVNNIHALFAGAPEEVREAIMSARTPDGNALFNSVGAMKFFAELARQRNPFGALIGADGGAMDQKGVDARIGEIEQMMRTNRAAYNKDEKVQAEYRNLLDARDRMKQRAA